MRLWTIQPKEVYEEVIRNGYCVTDPSKTEWIEVEQFRKAYDWLIQEMVKVVPKPCEIEVTYPWWAYYKMDGKTDLTLSDINFLDEPGTVMMALELEVPDNEVLLSDLDAWHFVLNDMWIDDSTDEDSWNKCLEYFDSLPIEVAEEVKIKSWDKVFDLTPIVTDWKTNGQDIQATFWVLRKEYVVSATEFVVQTLTGVD